jgi:hypothetical protein
MSKETPIVNETNTDAIDLTGILLPLDSASKWAEERREDFKTLWHLLDEMEDEAESQGVPLDDDYHAWCSLYFYARSHPKEYIEDFYGELCD